MRWSAWAANRDFGRRTIAYEVLIVLIGPILLLIFPALPFANNGHCDPWYVYGLYFNLPQQLHWSPHARQIGRLAETLPGYFLSYGVPSPAFDYTLFLLFFTPAVFFLYKTAALLFSRERAAFVAIFFALSPVVIGNYAVTFSGSGLTYEIISLYCAVRAIFSIAQRQLFKWMFLSGIAWGAALNAHLAILIFSGFIYLFFALSTLYNVEVGIRSRVVNIAAGATATSLGVFSATALLSTFASVAWGSQYWSTVFNQIEHISNVVENNATIYWQDDWYRSGTIIGTSLCGFGAAVITIEAYRRTLANNRAAIGSARLELMLAISFAATVMVLVVDGLLHGIFLQYEYYYVFLMPFFALAIFAPQIDGGIRATFPYVPFFAAACIIGIAIKQYAMPDWVDDHQTAESIVLAVLAVGLLTAMARTPRGPVLVAYLLVLALSALIVRPQTMGYQLWQRHNGSVWRDSYTRIYSGLKFLASTFSNPDVALNRPKFWVDRDAVSDGRAYPRSYLSCGSHPFPNVDKERWIQPGGAFMPGDVIVIVAPEQNLPDRTNKALRGLDLEADEIASKTIVDEEEGDYTILVVSVRKSQPR